MLFKIAPVGTVNDPLATTNDNKQHRTFHRFLQKKQSKTLLHPLRPKEAEESVFFRPLWAFAEYLIYWYYVRSDLTSNRTGIASVID